MSAAHVREVLRRLGEANYAGTAELLADGFVQEYPYPPLPGVPERIVGAAAFLAFAQPGMTAFAPYRFTIDVIYECTDPRTVIAEYRSHSHLLATGVPYGNHYIGVFRFGEDGLLERWREFLNPATISEVLGSLPDA